MITMANIYKGVIIEESLIDKKILDSLIITKTEIFPVTERNKTPWLSKWTLHHVEIHPGIAHKLAYDLSESINSEQTWYADFKNANTHYVIFKHKVFEIDREKPEQYQKVKEYGKLKDIPDYQLDFI